MTRRWPIFRRVAAIFREEIIILLRLMGWIQIVSTAAVIHGVTAFTSRVKMLMENGLCTLTPRIHSRVRLVSFSMALWMFSWGILPIHSFLGPGHKLEKKPGGLVGPLWKVDLRSFGFNGFVPKGEQWGLQLRMNPLCFFHNNALVASFITREEVRELARRDSPSESLPLRLHGIFLDVNQGNVRSSKEWSLTRPRGGVIAVGDGSFAVLTPAMIALYSASLEPLKIFQLSPQQQSHLWNLFPSPTGKSILIEYHYPEASFEWLDMLSQQLQPMAQKAMSGVSISDKEIAVSNEIFVRSVGFIHEVKLLPRDGGPGQMLCRVIVGKQDSCGGYPEFLSNDILALLMPHGFSIVPKSGGDSLLNVSFGKDEWLGRTLYASADGKRFAVTVWAHKNGGTFFDLDYHSVLQRIMVYDLPSRHVVYVLDANRQKIKEVSGVALSWDGSIMAILSDGMVEAYETP
jgi:hypothetical protein